MEKQSKGFQELIKKVKNIIYKFTEWLVEILFENILRWFLTDIAFTLLPIVVIVIIRFFLNGKLDILYLSPEWSFATIVLFGISITMLIEIKVKYQRDYSHKIYTGTRFYIILLIMSVLILALVVLRESGLKVYERILWPAQLIFFFVSIMTIYLSNFAKCSYLKIKKELPSVISREEYFMFVNDSLKNAYEQLIYTENALSKRDEIKYKHPINKQEMFLYEQEYKRDLQQSLKRLELTFSEIRPLLDNFFNFTPDIKLIDQD